MTHYNHASFNMLGKKCGINKLFMTRNLNEKKTGIEIFIYLRNYSNRLYATSFGTKATISEHFLDYLYLFNSITNI